MAIALGALVLALAVAVISFGLRAALPASAPSAPVQVHRGILD
ncbi:hypothetical protein R1X32_42850 [Rhodococcus opacus]